MNNQKINDNFNKKIAECVGLWLAEGDNKCNNEITFTNNEFSLIEFFHKNIKKLFLDYALNIRIYIYTSDGENINIPIKVNKINRYIDKRARKPYYMWRLASVDLNKKWKFIVNKCKNNPDCYEGILKGFFAGEGDIKSSSHNSRTIRISQKKCAFLEILLKHFNSEFRYRKENRAYYITHKDNWDRLAKIRIADLHPAKKEKFWKIYKGFKEQHYKHNYLKNSIYEALTNHHLPLELALKFNRSKARIQAILVDLKKENKINNFGVRSISYWIRNDQNVIIISKLKKKYLNVLGKNNKITKEIANYFNVGYKSSFNRLKELEKLGLVKRNKDKTWQKIIPNKKVIVI